MVIKTKDLVRLTINKKSKATIANPIMIKVAGTNKANIANMPKTKPANKIQPGNPSRYNTKMKEKKTKVEPVSFCNKIMTIGAKIIAAEMYWSLLFFSKFLLYPLRYLAKASAVPNLANSAGCILNPPISIHDDEPFTVVPIASTKTNKKMVIA